MNEVKTEKIIEIPLYVEIAEDCYNKLGEDKIKEIIFECLNKEKRLDFWGIGEVKEDYFPQKEKPITQILADIHELNEVD